MHYGENVKNLSCRDIHYTSYSVGNCKHHTRKSTRSIYSMG